MPHQTRWHLMFAALLAVGCSESEPSSPAVSIFQHEYRCLAPLDTSDCFAVLITKRKVVYTEQFVEVAKCTFEAPDVSGTMAKDPVGAVDVHCESADGELVVDLHAEGLAQTPASSMPGIGGHMHTARPELGWLRVRATGDAAAAFPEYAGGPVERVYRGDEVPRFLEGELKQPADFLCDSDGDGLEDEENGCPPLPRRAQGESVFQGFFNLEDDGNADHYGLDIDVTWLLSLPGLPLGCKDQQGHPRPCDTPPDGGVQ